MKRIAERGYTIEVTSWEDDGDNYATKRIVVQDKEYAVAILQMCKDIFVSRKDGEGEGGIGNMMDNEYEDGQEVILEYVADKPIIKGNEIDLDSVITKVMIINYDLMGSCELYFSRVFERGCIYYSDKDIYLDEI
jgi:hypothetical protein